MAIVSPSCRCGRARAGRFRPGDCAACWHRFNPQDAPAAPASPPPACRFDGGPVTVTLIHGCTKRPYPAQRLRCEHPEGAAAHPTPHPTFCRHKCPDFERATQGAQP